ncbi:MAG: GON domain-containing protein [Cystobacter sp.]
MKTWVSLVVFFATCLLGPSARADNRVAWYWPNGNLAVILTFDTAGFRTKSELFTQAGKLSVTSIYATSNQGGRNCRYGSFPANGRYSCLLGDVSHYGANSTVFSTWVGDWESHGQQVDYNYEGRKWSWFARGYNNDNDFPNISVLFVIVSDASSSAMLNFFARQDNGTFRDLVDPAGRQYWLTSPTGSLKLMHFVDASQGTWLDAKPASCLEYKLTHPSAQDGTYTLYVNGNASQPWTAYCHNMAGGPADYLTLTSTAPSTNFSQYTARSGRSGETNVRTVYAKVRIDPATLRVNTADQTFATSTGWLQHGDPVTSMTYGSAMNCDYGNTGVGNIDLRGTAFGVAPNQFAAAGYAAMGEATYSVNNQVVDLWNRGACGWMAAVGADHPFNTRGSQLQLEYRPPGT